jgi:C4-type Zn-finger protein
VSTLWIPKKVKIYDPKTHVVESSWKCSKCGYQGSVVIEDGNLEKQIKDLTKMDKLSKKLLK